MDQGITKFINKIGEITFSDASASNVKRENANIDGNTAMGMMLHYGSATSNYYCDEFVMGRKFSDAHNNRDMHVHDKDFYNTGTLTCCQIGLTDLFAGGFSTGHGYLREPQSIGSYSALAAIAIQSNQNDQHR